MLEIEFNIAAATRMFNEEYVPLECAHMDQRQRQLVWRRLCLRLEKEGRISETTRRRWTN